jgi:hypothetical protein
MSWFYPRWLDRLLWSHFDESPKPRQMLFGEPLSWWYCQDPAQFQPNGRGPRLPDVALIDTRQQACSRNGHVDRGYELGGTGSLIATDRDVTSPTFGYSFARCYRCGARLP